MKSFRFKTYLTSNIGELKSLTKELLSHCNRQVIKKRDFLLREGEKSSKSYFVEDGLLRQFSVDSKGKEHILQFAPENWFVANRESEYLNKTSSYFIEAIENSTVFVIETDLIKKISQKNPRFIEFNTTLLHKHIARMQKRVTQLQSCSALERYLDFIKTYPDVLLRVPQIYVASYLGISPESLSRVRKDLANKPKFYS